jgi:hypothetical protein
MKKLTILSGLLALSISVKSQNTSPWPGSGNVGIGTTSPTDILEVLGSNNGAGSGVRVTQNGTGAAWLRLTNNGSSCKDYLVHSSGTGSGEGPGHLVFRDATAQKDRMVIHSSGRVGIGADNWAPAYSLDLLTAVQTDGLQIRTGTSGNLDALLMLNCATSGGHKYSIGSIGTGHSPNINGDLSVYDWTTGTSKLHLTAAGNVGIGGTIQPTKRFHILTNTSSDDGINIEQNGSGASALYLNGTSSGRTNWSLKSGSASLPGYFFLNNENTGNNAMNISSSGNVGIGTTGISAQLAIRNTVSGNSRAVYVEHTATNAIGVNVFANGQSNNAGVATGIVANASYAETNYGGRFYAYGDISGVTNYGVYGRVGGNLLLGSLNYAVYGDVSGNGNLGSGNNWAGYFDGDVYSTTNFYPSDKRIKKNIVEIGNSLSTIKKLNPVNYNFDVEGNPDLALPSQKQYGFLSQEIQEILPEFTKSVIHPAKLDENGKEIYPRKEILGLNYNGFIALLTKGVQEQQKMIEDQAREIAELKDLMNNQNKTGNATGLNSMNSAADGFALDQNIPNPFSNETVINYTLPQQIKNASLIVYDLSGKQLTSFPLELNAKSISITSEKLSAGIYIYSVMADGKIMDSKRMVVSDKQ